MNNYAILWIAIMVALTVVELCTYNMITIWFVAGGAVAFAASLLGASLPIQLWIFVIVSVATLVLTKPLVTKKLRADRISTNADRIIGMKAVVTEDISPDKFAVKVNVGGQEWSAVSSDGETITEGNTVTVEKIDGVKLVVK